MHRKYLVFGIVILLFLMAGCIEEPQSPLSSIPMILIDYIEETEETKVFVHGIDDHLFSNMTIQINEESICENFTYELHLSTTLEKFMLNITVWHKDKEYEYIGNLTLIEDDDEIILEIEDKRHEKPIKRSFSYSIIMERKE